MYDTIIIGAGMSGLAAGIRLALYDRRVVILERHSTIGGLNSFYRLRGRSYDVGLHALTNYTPKGARRGPLARLLRQLRLSWDEFSLAPQTGSAIVFPDATLQFGNDVGLLESEIAARFPGQADSLRRLVARLADYEQLGSPESLVSSRQVLAGLIDDPLLREMLLCPILYYGGAWENDMPFGLFSVLFRSMFLEGLARPAQGIRVVLRTLVRKFKRLGGELRLRSGVRRIVARDDEARHVVLDDGATLDARNILSSAGWPETLALCEPGAAVSSQPAGRMSVVETVWNLDCQPRDVGFPHTIVFFNDSPRFHYERPEDPVDLRSGVICSPNNYQYERPPEEGVLRVSALANYDAWTALDGPSYGEAKRHWGERLAAAALRHVSGFCPEQGDNPLTGGAPAADQRPCPPMATAPFFRHVVDTDMFTPVTIHRFTGRAGGAVYGSPEKRYDGTTHLKNLFLCGTDQGLVGVVGALVSGTTMANRHLLGVE